MEWEMFLKVLLLFCFVLFFNLTQSYFDANGVEKMPTPSFQKDDTYKYI